MRERKRERERERERKRDRVCVFYELLRKPLTVIKVVNVIISEK